MEITFTNPIYLWALASIPVLILIHFMSLNYFKTKAFEFSNFVTLARVSKGANLKKNIILLIIRILTFICIILAVSGSVLWYLGEGNDFDYVLAIDTSSSMLSSDYEPNRLEAAKSAANGFVEILPTGSRMALISFAGTTFVKQTLTESKLTVKQQISDLNVESVGGTDLGEAIVSASNLLFHSDKGRAIILVTDGSGNVGLPLEEGISYAKTNHVLVHTIGIGTEEGGVLEPTKTILKLNEDNLKNISLATEGFYFRAYDVKELNEAYTKILSSTVRKVPFDLTTVLLLSSLLFSLIDWGLMNTRFRRIP